MIGIWEYKPGENQNNGSPCMGYYEQIQRTGDYTVNPDGSTNSFFYWDDRFLSEGYRRTYCNTRGDDEVGSFLVREAK